MALLIIFELLQISVLDTTVNKIKVVVKLYNKRAFFCLITSRFVKISKVVPISDQSCISDWIFQPEIQIFKGL